MICSLWELVSALYLGKKLECRMVSWWNCCCAVFSRKGLSKYFNFFHGWVEEGFQYWSEWLQLDFLFSFPYKMPVNKSEVHKHWGLDRCSLVSPIKQHSWHKTHWVYVKTEFDPKLSQSKHLCSSSPAAEWENNACRHDTYKLAFPLFFSFFISLPCPQLITQGLDCRHCYSPLELQPPCFTSL